MTIRPAQATDTDAIQAILTENGLGHDGVDYTVWTHPCLVAVREGRVVGFIQALAGRPYSMISELCVARAWHRKGVAPKLLEHMETLLRAMGATCWLTFERKDDPLMQEYVERWGGERLGDGVAYLRRL